MNTARESGLRAVESNKLSERMSKMAKRYYIAYGSNLNVRQMRIRCPKAKIKGTAMLEGWELLFRGSKTGSYLTIGKSRKGKVPVAVWEVTTDDEKALDRYEGYPEFYYKKDIYVEVKGKKLKAFAYIMHEDRPIGIPTAMYLRTCLEGYDIFDFDEKYLRKAYFRCREVLMK